MKNIFFILVFLLMSVPANADLYYIFIDKVGIVEQGKEDGQNEIGDVIDVVLASSMGKPTQAELSRYHIIKVDMSEADRALLLSSREQGGRITLNRTRKIDYESFTDKNQEATISRNDLISSIITK